MSLEISSLYGVRLIAKGDMVVKAANDRREGFEPRAVARWVDWCQDCDSESVMIDAGAYTGFYSILAGMHDAKCIGFEIDLRIWRRARENVEINSFTVGREPEIKPLGLANYAREVKFYSKSFLTSAGSLHKPEDRSAIERFGFVVDLDRYLESEYPAQRVHAMKIDVERFELAVLLGAVKTIKRDRPRVLIEILDASQYRAVRGFFDEIGGYKCESVEIDMFVFTPE